MGKKIKVFVRRASLLVICMMFISCSIIPVFAGSEETYGGLPASQWQEQLQNVFLESFTGVEIASLYDAVDFYRENGMDTVADIYEFWIAKQPTLGEYTGFGEFTINENNGVIDAVQIVNFENDTLEFEIVQNTESGSADFFLREHVEVQVPLSQLMAKAGMNTLMGVGTVFVVLTIMIILISLFKYVNAIETAIANKKSGKDNTPDFVEQISKRESQDAAQNVAVTADSELIAVIAAAIAAATGDDTDSFVVRSIKRR